MGTNAKLAVFTNKLGIAILIAGLFRVHAGTYAVKACLVSGEAPASSSDLWFGLSRLASYVAPLALLAGNFGSRSEGHKQGAAAALIGVTLPLFGTLLLVGVISAATFESPFYLPSLNPNIAMALWGHAAASSLPGFMMVTTITTFGAVRFGAKALDQSIRIKAVGPRLRWVLLAFLVAVIVAITLHRDFPNSWDPIEIPATCLAVMTAVVTSDYLTGRRRSQSMRRVDWVGVTALSAGLGTPFYVPAWMVGATGNNGWWHPWLLPSYGVAFLVCLILSVRFRELSFSGRGYSAPAQAVPPSL